MKRIKEFHYKDYGLFIDLEDIATSVAIDMQTGDILLNEGHGDDCFHGAVILRQSFIDIFLEQMSEAEFQVILRFGKERTHSLGVTSDKAEAEKWIRRAASIMASTAPLAGPTGKERRILIIEDDPVHLRLMTSELEGWYTLDVAADSESALLRLQGPQSSRYDLVIVDLRLPARRGEPATVEEGLKVLDALNKGGTSTPITFVVSGNLIDRIQERIEALGIVKRAFEKPFSPKELHASIDSFLEEEAALLQKIHGVFPEELWRQYNEINDKLHNDTITPEEHEKLLTLIERIELADAERMQYLIEFAQLRQVSVETLMEQLDIRRGEHSVILMLAVAVADDI